MAGPFSRWIVRRVIRSALAFESDSIDLYRRLTENLFGVGAEVKSCSDELQGSLCHLLGEEQAHWRLLEDAASGRVSLDELEKLLVGHRYSNFAQIVPLSGAERERWQADLSRALAQEEKTWIFYSNLRRMSKIPIVKRVFEVVASMEHEHLQILRRLLGMPEEESSCISS
jgi:rubrerythrin